MVGITRWSYDINELAKDRIKELTNHSKLVRNILVFPNCHYDIGKVKGIVCATKDCLIPALIGNDIGCGVLSIKTDYLIKDGNTLSLSPKEIKEILQNIVLKVPIGSSIHTQPQIWSGFYNSFPGLYSCGEGIWKDEGLQHLKPKWLSKVLFNMIKRSLSTLGNKDHFIELQHDSKGLLWITIHTGSRTLGTSITKYYSNRAVDFKNLQKQEVPNDKFSYIPIIESKNSTSSNYLRDIKIATEFAVENRTRISNKVIDSIQITTGPIRILAKYDVIHNSISSITEPNKEEIILHRCGVIKLGDKPAPILGSQSSKTLIVKGKNNQEVFLSAPAYSGREFFRHEKDSLKLEDCEKEMRGIVHLGWDSNSIRKIKAKKSINLSGSPLVYKNLDKVMLEMNSIVSIEETLLPIASLKG